ncbi:hypothetical protein HPB47_024441 [Ixodes persulcatus]|uniref:Uncharacterized protein n=1 Tax=Ixodes persulcatus TaxID=34615 RepID=A0AC60Q497_IXOPE|nr:hypothetical protein HPB47_024441 [Ixodes persulcatus]
MPLQRNAAVCELHFDKQFVSRHFEHVVDGQSVLIERARPFLLPGAVPTVFPNVPSYLSKPVPRKRNPKERLCPPPALHDKRQRMDEVLQPLPGEEPDEPATTTTEPRLAFNHADIAFPSDRWGKHVFSGVPLKVAYSVCLPGPDTSLLCAAKLVLFTVTDDTVTHEVFVRGVKVVLDEPGDPSSILQAVDSPGCSHKHDRGPKGFGASTNDTESSEHCRALHGSAERAAPTSVPFLAVQEPFGLGDRSRSARYGAAKRGGFLKACAHTSPLVQSDPAARPGALNAEVLMFLPSRNFFHSTEDSGHDLYVH